MFVLLALLIGVAMGVAVLAGAAGKRASGEKPDLGPDFNSPRANIGDAIPFILGTRLVDAPLCIYSGPVTRGDPYSVAAEPDQVQDKNQYRNTIDLLLCERIVKGGSTLGSITLRRIWYNENFLWDGSGFAVPVQTSGSLLDHDPNLNAGPSQKPGGVTDAYERGNGWWYGGCLEKLAPSGPFVALASGPLLGWWEIEGEDPYTKGYGLERIRFYSAQSGVEIENAQINSELQLANGEYPSYPKFSRLVFEDFCWGGDATVGRISCEVTISCPAPEIGDTVGLMADGLGVNPVSVLYQLLTCVEFAGGTKLPPPNIASFTVARQIADDEQLGMSLQLTSRTKLADVVKTILNHLDGVFFKDPASGEIILTLNRAPTSDPPEFDQTHTLEIVEISKSTWTAAHSQVRVNYEHLNLAGNMQSASSVAVAKDPGLAESAGLTESLDETSSTTYSGPVAAAQAARRLAEVNTPRTKLVLKMNRLPALDNGPSMMDLRLGDVFRWSYAARGIVGTTFRLVNIDLGELDSNALTVTAIQDKYIPPNHVDPPGGTDTYLDPPLETVEITTHNIITAPYYFAKRGLGSDARFALTSSPIYQITADTSGLQFAVNYDRLLCLVERPHRTANRFVWNLFRAGGTFVESKSVPYTETATLVNWSTSIQLSNVSDVAISVLQSAPCFLLIDEELIQTDPTELTVTAPGAVTIANVWRHVQDSPRASTLTIGDKVWILELTEKWALDRLSGLHESSREEYYQFDVELPTDGDFNDFQTLTFECYSQLTNIDASKKNVSLQTDPQFLQDRANRCLPIRELDLATSSVSLSSAATSFTFDFEQLTSVPRLYQQRELAPYPATGGPAFDLLLDPEQDSGDGASVERVLGVLTDTQEASNFHVAKLEVWYEYLTGPLAGTIRRSGNVGDAGDGDAFFDATAEATARSIRCYLRTAFAPFVLGDAGRVPIRYSVTRSMTIELTRT